MAFAVCRALPAQRVGGSRVREHPAYGAWAAIESVAPPSVWNAQPAQLKRVITEAGPYAPKKGGYSPNRTPRTTYAAMISRLDKEVGRILAALEKAGVADNTIIVFSGDNGATHDVGGADTKYFDSAGGLRGLKGSLHEGGVREPTVVRWPAGIKAGTRSHRLSGFEDWFATFSELAGVKPGRAKPRHSGTRWAALPVLCRAHRGAA